MSNSVTFAPQGNNGQCYQIYAGTRSNTPPTANTNLTTNPLTNTPTNYVLVSTNTPSGIVHTVYKRNPNGAGFMSKQITTPTLFYDVNSELLCPIGFPQNNSGLGGLLSTPSSAGLLMSSAPVYASVTPVSSTTYTSNGVTTSSAQNTTSSSVQNGANLITVAAPAGTNPQAVAGAINASASLSTAAPSGISLNANLVKLEPSASHLVVTQLRDSQLYVGPLQINGPHQLEGRAPVGMILHGRAVNKSILSVGDAGAYAAGHAVNCSVIHTDNDGGHTHAFARENSKALSLGHGATTAGEASCGSVLTAGGTPNFNSPLCSKSRFRLMTVGAGVVQHRRNVFSLSKNSRCPTLDFLLEDSTPNKSIAPLICQVCTDITSGEHAPGFGHASLVHGMASTNSLIQTSGDGAAALGVAHCNETLIAAGRGSFAQGRNNLALSPYSQATGQNSVSHMYGQYAQGVKGSHNTNVSECCNVCQFSRVITHSHVHCISVVDGTGTITGFLLEYRLVLGNTPEDPVINTPDGITITNFAFPSLVCPGVAKVDVQVSSPGITTSRGIPFPDGNSDAFAVDYCFFVQRIDSDNQSCHRVIPEPPATVPIIGGCIFSPTVVPYFVNGATPPAGAPISPILEADKQDNLCGGFTILFTEFVPLMINGVQNPRVGPPPTVLNTALGARTVFQVLARIICATFQWTQAPSGFTRIACSPQEIRPIPGIAIPTYTAYPPLNACPPSSININNGGGNGSVVGATASNCPCPQTTSTFQSAANIFAGTDFTVSPDFAASVDAGAFNMIQGMNEQFASH